MGDDFAMGYAMGQDNNNCNGGDWFGSGGIWGLLILALLFGWGGAGFGGGGLFGGMFGGGGNGALTRADINAGFQFNDLQNGVRGLCRPVRLEIRHRRHLGRHRQRPAWLSAGLGCAGPPHPRHDPAPGFRHHAPVL